MWAAFYARFDQDRGTFRVEQDRYYKRTKYGWPVKVLWLVAREQASPVQLAITRISSGRPIWVHIGGLHDALTRFPQLDPSAPGHPDSDTRPETHEWGSNVFFPSAGCYAVHAAWPGGAWHFVFGFGR